MIVGHPETPIGEEKGFIAKFRGARGCRDGGEKRCAGRSRRLCRLLGPLGCERPPLAE